jgi:hypothetical protein
MTQDQVEQFIQKMLEDPQLRSAFRDDPEATLRNANVDVSDEELAQLRNADLSALPDQELVARISRSGGVQRWL